METTYQCYIPEYGGVSWISVQLFHGWEETVIIIRLGGLNLWIQFGHIGGIKTYEGFCFSGWKSHSTLLWVAILRFILRCEKSSPKGWRLKLFIFPLVYNLPNVHGRRYANEFNPRDLEQGLDPVGFAELSVD